MIDLEVVEMLQTASFAAFNPMNTQPTDGLGWTHAFCITNQQIAQINNEC